MAFSPITSPHMHQPLDTAAVMRWVLLATVPGILVLTWFFGFGIITNLLIASAAALAFEALALRLRARPLKFYLGDNSALVTAFLLAIAVPPASPWWLIVIGIACAILLAKHLYGGLGYNPFNPAMVGYVVLLISFPVEMTQWLAPRGAGAEVMGPIEALRAAGALLPEARLDGFTMATPLDLVKQNQALTLDELATANPQFGAFSGLGWEWVNLAFLAGGGLLLYKKIFTWHAPVSMLLALLVMAGIFYGGEQSGSAGSPLFHLLSGATMLGAFFIVTDPITSAVSNRGRIIYGAAIGVLLYTIRRWGNYPDAVAFAVLLMNFAAPLVDHYTQPRVYGHSRGGPKGGSA